MRGIYFNGIDPDDFKKEIEVTMRSLLEEFRSSQTNISEKEEYLTRTEVAELLKISVTTVYRWTRSGKLKSYGIGNRVFYKSHEIEECLIDLTPRSHD